MPQYINTNIASLNAQRKLEGSSADLHRSIERLSSGLRINGAQDDAAGLAIASRMDSQITGMEQASRNAMDAISLSQTAEGALGEQVDMLQRIRELAIQSANGILSDSDRSKIHNEARAIMNEVDRVAKSTSFNGVNLLDGVSGISTVGSDFQIGSEAGQTLRIQTGNTSASGLKLDERQESLGTTVTNPTTDLSFYVNGVAIDVDADATDTVATKAQKIVDAVNEGTSASGVLARMNAAGDGVEYYAASDSTVPMTFSTDAAGATPLDNTTTPKSSDLAGTTIDGTTNQVSVSVNSSTGSLKLSDQKSSEIAILQLNHALDKALSIRSDMGTYQNRLDATISNLSTQGQHLSSAKSRIEDADFARETAIMTKNQIMSQAGVAMLSQANSLPQNVLSLLQG